MPDNFNTREYEFTHGKRPAGRGLWAFAIVRNPSPEEVFWARDTYRQGGTFAQAKKEATQRFGRDADIYVLT